MKLRSTLSVIALGSALSLICAAPLQAREKKPGVKTAKAVSVLQAKNDSSVTGTLTIEKHGEGYLVKGKITGLTPGEHGFHIHEFGDCSADDGTSAGGHFNPSGHEHGGPQGHHVGDLGNITADKKGVAFIDIKDSSVKLHGKHSVVGRAFIVHADKDDLSSQPSGAAGKRVACGVIGVAKP